jgi:hypothetical protein
MGVFISQLYVNWTLLSYKWNIRGGCTRKNRVRGCESFILRVNGSLFLETTNLGISEIQPKIGHSVKILILIRRGEMEEIQEADLREVYVLVKRPISWTIMIFTTMVMQARHLRLKILTTATIVRKKGEREEARRSKKISITSDNLPARRRFSVSYAF